VQDDEKAEDEGEENRIGCYELVPDLTDIPSPIFHPSRALFTGSRLISVVPSRHVRPSFPKLDLCDDGARAAVIGRGLARAAEQVSVSSTKGSPPFSDARSEAVCLRSDAFPDGQLCTSRNG
jgi:hypothetical protein